MVEIRLVSCLTKVFCDEAPPAMTLPPEGLAGEKGAFQLAFKGGERSSLVQLKIDSAIAEYITLYRVKQVPVGYTAPQEADEDYLRKDSGLFPDLLMPPDNEHLRLYPDHWEAVWLEIALPKDFAGGEYPIRLSLMQDDGTVLASCEAAYRHIPVRLLPQKLIHTRWFHCDGLCQYYHVEMFSEAFWRICESFLRAARDMGVNCLLTPVHTPPLDTRVGGERLTCQLVDICKKGEQYVFGFEKLEKWVRLAQKLGFRYFEIAHLFTQWGAEHAPKIVSEGSENNGEIKRIFGWESEAAGAEYVGFLKQYLPALKKELRRLGVLENCFFHISDEPNERHLENYLKVKNAISEELKDLRVIDALSDIEFYRRGVVSHPVPASDRIEPFLEAKVPALWTYYCCGQFRDVSNCFIAMPAARTRILGLQLYKYDIAGFLQWGFNFYNSQYSEYPINPYLTTDGDGFSPAGDCFIVYPGSNGEALPSIRAKLIAQAMSDLRALELLETFIGKEEVLRLVEKDIDPITFKQYPRDEAYLLNLRRRINAAIEKYALPLSRGC